VGRLAAIVIAGGEARRFGSDKLILRNEEGRTLIDVVVSGVAQYAEPVIVVGPKRAVSVPATWTRESPAGSGPGAALIAGLASLPENVTEVAVLAGDGPRGPSAIAPLLAALRDRDAAVATAIDANGREQPITAVYAVAPLRQAVAHYGDGAGMSIRQFLDDLRPLGVVGVPDEIGAADDVDRPDDAHRLGFRPDPSA